MIGGSSASAELATLSPWEDRAPSITTGERQARLERARQLMRDQGADALVVGAGPSLNYFVGLNWGMKERLVALIMTLANNPVLVAPKFEDGSLAAALSLEIETQFWEEHQSPFALVADVLRQAGSQRLALDPVMPYWMVDRLGRAAPSMAVFEATSVIDACRMIKSPAELALMRQAKRMTLEVQRRAARILRPGIGSGEVVRFINDAHRALGAGGSTFCIAQFGRSTAFPHGLPGEDHLREGDVVLIDTGCAVHGYNSDITRTYVFGAPSREQRHVWDAEARAQQAAFDAAWPGVTCESVDAAARRTLEADGFGPGYRLPGLPHRTGHSIGMSLHEAPYLVKGDQTPLQPGMCFSNEPTIVVPEQFGVRLEDHFFVTETGADWFTERSPSIDRPF